ncbi:MAG: hypothetical protein KGL56_00160 [Alphaproteobacteria bacterium]|nr:hypothetical protein [Alphaproteobacteria bacterium]
MTMPVGMPEFEDVPQVEPEQLCAVLVMVYAWTSDYHEDTSQTMGEEDLHELLDRIAHRFAVEAPVAVALFQRALALSTLTANAALPDTLFEHGLPGCELCAAAAKVPVLNERGESEGEVSHNFDEATIRAALVAMRN